MKKFIKNNSNRLFLFTAILDGCISFSATNISNLQSHSISSPPTYCNSLADLNPIQENFSLLLKKFPLVSKNISSKKSISTSKVVIDDYVPTEKLNISLPDIITYFMSSF